MRIRGLDIRVGEEVPIIDYYPIFLLYLSMSIVYDTRKNEYLKMSFENDSHYLFFKSFFISLFRAN